MNASSPQKIGILTIIILVFIALLADLLSIIPFVGTFVGPIFWASVALYLYIKGFGFLNLRRLAPMAISVVGELIPAIQALPTIFVGMIALVILIKTREITGISLKDASHGKFSRPQGLNNAGVRAPRPKNTQIPSSPTRNQNTQPLVTDGVRTPQR
jgi:hypothetical protein